MKFSDARVWRYAIAALSNFIEEGVFVVDEKGLSLRAIDSARINLVEFIMPRDAFAEYDVKGAGSVAVNLEDLAKVLRNAARGDELALAAEEGALLITFEGHGRRTFSLPQLTMAAEEISELSINFTAKASLVPALFNDVIKAVSGMADTITLKATKKDEKLIVAARGDVAESITEFSLDSGSLLEIAVEEDSESTYTIEYIENVLPVAKIANKLDLEFGTQVPLKLEFELPQGGRLRHYVSPRIE
ncbi:MAG: DNA polymerase sliding clamp [Desulfurococcaceae archaeon]